MRNIKLTEELKKNKENKGDMPNIKQYYFQNIDDYKKFFREYRTLNMINNKSDNLINLKNIKLYNKDNQAQVDLIFPNEGIDLYSLINSKIYDYRNQKNLIKWILFQILKGIETLHSSNIIHRNINPRNILVSSTGKITLSGFEYSINDIESKFVEDKIIGNLPYIAPECLLGLNYDNKIDIWSTGIIMIELYLKATDLLAFKKEKNDEYSNVKDDYNNKFLSQLKNIFNFFYIKSNFNFNDKNNIKDSLSLLNINKDIFAKIFGDISNMDDYALDLLKELITFNPKDRISAKDALKSEYFKEFHYFLFEDYHLSKFLINLEKNFQKKESEEQKMSKFKKELINIYLNKGKK